MKLYLSKLIKQMNFFWEYVIYTSIEFSLSIIGKAVLQTMFSPINLVGMAWTLVGPLVIYWEKGLSISPMHIFRFTLGWYLMLDWEWNFWIWLLWYAFWCGNWFTWIDLPCWSNFFTRIYTEMTYLYFVDKHWNDIYVSFC